MGSELEDVTEEDVLPETSLPGGVWEEKHKETFEFIQNKENKNLTEMLLRRDFNIFI